MARAAAVDMTSTARVSGTLYKKNTGFLRAWRTRYVLLPYTPLLFLHSLAFGAVYRSAVVTSDAFLRYKKQADR